MICGVEVEQVERIEAHHLPPDRLSVVVYGPGHGESVLLRLPDGTFGVVDGCGEAGDRRDCNPVLTLLQGLSPRAELRFVALTHPHDDHVRGLNELIKEFAPKRLWWAGAEHAKTFEPYLKLLRERREKGARADRPSPSKAIERVLQAIHDHVESGHAHGVALSDLKVLLHLRDLDPPLQIQGVLPSTASVRNALAWLRRDGESTALEADPDGSTADVEPGDGPSSDVNDVSGALYITWGEARILLTGDALIGPGRGRQARQRGWRWVQEHGLLQCAVVKVAHHGSSGAHDPELWRALSPKIALVTPYQRAKGAMPPRPKMLVKLLETGAAVGLTSPPEPDWWTGSGLSSPPRGCRVSVADMPGRDAHSAKRSVNEAIAVVLSADGAVLRILVAGEARFLTADIADGAVPPPAP